MNHRQIAATICAAGNGAHLVQTELINYGLTEEIEMSQHRHKQFGGHDEKKKGGR